MVPPVFDVSSFQKLIDQVEKPLVTNTPLEYAQQDFRIQVVEKPFDIALHLPPRPCHLRLDLFQSGMATSFWSKSVGVSRERRLVDRF